jgi:hypothetical protein
MDKSVINPVALTKDILAEQNAIETVKEMRLIGINSIKPELFIQPPVNSALPVFSSAWEWKYSVNWRELKNHFPQLVKMRFCFILA